MCCGLVSFSANDAQSAAWRFIAVGDTRGPDSSNPINSLIVGELANEIVRQGAAFVVVPGDLVQSGSAANFQAWKSAMSPVYMAGIPVFPVLGNHDANDASAFIQTFGAELPDNGPVGEVNRTYAFSHDNVLVLALDTYVNLGRVNQAWINSVLQQNTLPHVFAFGHMPAFKANHTDCLDDYPTERDTFWTGLGTAGARVYFCGHDHFYDHARVEDGDGNPNNDVHQLIVGGGGAPLYTSYVYNGANTIWSPVNVYHENQYGYALVEIDGGTARVTYFHRTGEAAYVASNDIWTFTVGGSAPPTPTGLSAIPGDRQVALSWNPSSGATSYQVKRAESSPTATWSTIASPTPNAFVDTAVVNDTTYYYAVSAVNAAGASSDTGYVSATPNAISPPEAPVLSAAGTKRAINLSWTAAARASSYKLTRSLTSGGPVTLVREGLTSTSFVDRKVRSGFTYYYTVIALNAGGETPSNEASARIR